MDDLIFERYTEREANTAQLAIEQIQTEAEIDIEEENHDPTRICWSNLRCDDSRCKIITGLSSQEFSEIFDLCGHSISANTGRGQRGEFSKEDKLVIVLCYLKHYETKDKLADTFSISKPHVHRIVADTTNNITSVLYDHFVRFAHIDISERVMFDQAKFVLDATFQTIWTPIGTYDERKRYYSGKHKAYGL